MERFLKIVLSRVLIVKAFFSLISFKLVMVIFVWILPLAAQAQDFRAASSGSSQSGETSITINKPAGTTNRDVMIAAIGFRPDGAVITAPSGWTLILRTNQSTGAPNAQAIYYKVAGSGEPDNYSWTFDASTGSAGGIMSFYNVNVSSPINVSGGQATAGSLTHAAPSVNTTSNSTMIVTAHSFGSCATWTAPTGMTEAVDVANLAVPNGSGESLEMNYVVQASSGTTGTKTATASGDADAAVNHIIALAPAAPFVAYNTGNWSSRSTWITTKTGTITVSSGSTAVTGSGTAFTTELQVGDNIYSTSSTAFNVIGTVASITDNTNLTLTSGSSNGYSNFTLYSHGVPGSSDNIQVGYMNGVLTTTLTVDGNYTANYMYFVENNGLNYTVEIPSSSSLTLSSYLYMIARNGNGNVHTMNVSGTLSAQGLYLQGATTEAANRVSKLNIQTGGVVTITGDVNIHTNSKASKCIVSSEGTGRLNLAGNFLQTSATNYSNTPYTTPSVLSPTTTILAGTNTFASTGIINFNGTDKLQVLPISSTTTYGNIYGNNTGNNLVTLNGAITTSNVLGNIEVQQGTFSTQGATTNAALGTTGFAIAGNGTATLSVANSAFLNVYATFPTGFGTVTLQPTSTVNYNGTGAQTINAHNYGNLTVSAGASARTITLASTGTIGVYSNFTPSSINNSYTITGSTVAYNGTLAQTMPSNFATYTNLTINNAAGISLAADVTFNSILTLTSGVITAGSYNLIAPSGATVSRTSGHVYGNFKKWITTGTKTFEVGTSADYTPMNITFATVLVDGYVTGKSTNGDHPSISSSCLSSTKSVNVYYTLTNISATISTFDIIFNYLSGNVDAGATASAFNSKVYSASSWSALTISGTPTTTSTTVSGLNTFGDYQIAEPGISVTSQPSSVSMCGGSNASFSVTVSGTSLTYQWEESTDSGGSWATISDGGVYSNATTTALTLTNPSASLNGYQYRCVINGCSAYSATSSAVTLTITAAGSWLGTSDNLWSTATNWCGGILPTSSSDVIVPSGTTYSVEVSGAGAVCRNLTIDASATLTIISGGTLSIYGNITNNGTYIDNGTTVLVGSGAKSLTGAITFNNLTLNNSSGATLNNATTVAGVLTLTSGTLASGGNLTVNLNTGAIAGTGTGAITGNVSLYKTVSSDKYHYISSPLSGLTVNEWDDDVTISTGTQYNNLYKYNETYTDTTKAVGWEAVTSLSASLEAMRGYALYFRGAATMDVTGTYTHNESFSNAALTNTISGNSGSDGWNLVGNPYPSTVDWDALSGWTKTNLDGAIYLWDPVNNRYASYVDGAGTNGGVPYIPSMQAFWVKVNAAGSTGTLGMNNSVRTTAANPSIWRVASTENILKLKTNSNGYSDETIIRFLPDANETFDSRADAYKKSSSGNTPSLYTESKGVKYSINSLPNSLVENRIPVVLKAGFTGIYTISAEEIGVFGSEYSIVFEDSLLGVSQDLRSNPHYTCNMGVGDTVQRFYLHFRKAVVNSMLSGKVASISIRGSKQTVYVRFENIHSGKASIMISDVSGKEKFFIENADISAGEYAVTLPSGESGIYVIRVVSPEGFKSEKVFLHQ